MAVVNVPEIIKKKTGKEFLEIRNGTDKPILASVCRSKLTNQLYVHIGEAHGGEVEVKPHNYAIIEIRQVDY